MVPPKITVHTIIRAAVRSWNRCRICPSVLPRSAWGSGRIDRPGAATGGALQPALTLPARVKIGRYIAMIIVPTEPPMNTIMIGSRSEVIAATATSTSSS